MTNNRFMDMVRQYARMALRKRQSFAAPVNKLIELRVATIATEEADEGKRARRVQDAKDFVLREYASADRDFELTAGG